MQAETILLISNENDPHIDIVIPELEKRGLKYVRFHPDAFPTSSELDLFVNKQSGYLRISGKTLNLDDVYSVWFRRPLSPIPSDKFDENVREFCKIESEATINNLYALLKDRLWISYPKNIESARIKTHQLQLATKLGFRVPRTLITNNPERVHEFYKTCESGMILKTIKSQWIEVKNGVGQVILTTLISERDLERLSTLRHNPSLFQEYVPKKFEIRTSVIGNHCLSAALYSQENPLTIIDWKRNADGIRYAPYELPKKINDRCVDLVHSLGLNFGGIDLIVTPENEFVFIEINPNGQWGWVEEKTGMPIKNTLVDFLTPIKKHLYVARE